MDSWPAIAEELLFPNKDTGNKIKSACLFNPHGHLVWRSETSELTDTNCASCFSILSAWKHDQAPTRLDCFDKHYVIIHASHILLHGLTRFKQAGIVVSRVPSGFLVALYEYPTTSTEAEIIVERLADAMRN
eukprot:m.283769 g.283769  ORF g.283769 m.283769 type:complete len:132 (-) comp19420_c0_seq4:136-531(-)